MPPRLKPSIKPGKLGRGVYRKDTPLVRLYLYGNDLARDLAPFQKMITYHAPRTIGVKATLGGAKIFRRAVRQESRPPSYALTRRGQRAKKRGQTAKLSRRHFRPDPSTRRGYAWWTGTLRRSWRARLISVGKYLTWSGMGPDPRKGQPPGWSRWGKPKNAYEYANYVEFGTEYTSNGVHHQIAPRPVVQTAFKKQKKLVAAYMLKEYWAYIQKIALASRAGQARRRALKTRLGR